MSDNIYCYPESDVLINKLNIKDRDEYEGYSELYKAKIESMSSK